MGGGCERVVNLKLLIDSFVFTLIDSQEWFELVNNRQTLLNFNAILIYILNIAKLILLVLKIVSLNKSYQTFMGYRLSCHCVELTVKEIVQ